MNFYDLAPTRNADLLVYEEALDYVFANDDIRNIAITGSYGSGKSSVIETYRKNKQKRFISISLANFQAEQSDEEHNLEKTIEGKILNQLVQQIPVQNIPLSSFRIKKSDQSKVPFWFSIGCCLFLACISYLAFFDNVGKYIASAVAIALLGGFLYCLCKLQYDKNIFKKISIQGNDVEIFSDSKDSYFDKYLNEVLYLFENADVDGIVFEDIDRFDNIKVFEQLREVNLLVNARSKNKKSDANVVRFFYLLRDDMFQSKDRTKFFDYILPIVPILDSSNSYDKLREYLTDAGLYDRFDDYFLRGVSLYIDDLRILKNIYNEFTVYNAKINRIELDLNKLFAMIIYKNLFPKDFASLQLNQGFVYTLFDRKKNLREVKLSKYEEEYSNLKNAITECEREELRTLEELDIIKTHKESSGTEGDHNWVKTEYPKRKTAIQRYASEELDNLRKRKIEIDVLKKEIENASLSELLQGEDLDEVFASTKFMNALQTEEKFCEIKESSYFGLLQYLLSRGFIDETYFDYMGFFYPSSLSINDKVFLRSVIDRKAKPFDLKLDAPGLVAENLAPSEFKCEGVLNYSLIDYVLSADTIDNARKMDEFINQLKRENRYDYIIGYLASDFDSKKLVVAINRHWTEAFYSMLESNKIGDNALKEYSYITVQYNSSEELEECNINGCLAHYVSSDDKYLSLPDVNCDKLISGFRALDVQFEALEYTDINENLFNQVYRENMYVINANNISLMLKLKCGIQNVDEIMAKLCTLIFTESDEPLYRYLYENIDLSLEVYLNMYEGHIDDSPDIIRQILNCDSIAEDIKIKYINRLNKRIGDISQIEEASIRNALLIGHHIDYTVKNIIHIFMETGLDEKLVEFINMYDQSLDYYDEIEDDETIENFIDAVICSTDISDEKYRQILANLCEKMTRFDIMELAPNRVNVFIEENLIDMNFDNLDFIRQNYFDCRNNFIIKNIDEYISLVSRTPLDRDELMMVLDSGDISDEQKILLLEHYNDSVSIIGKNYSDFLIGYILHLNLDLGDIPELLETYEDKNDPIKQYVWKVFCEHIESVIENSDYIQEKNWDDFFKETKISLDDRVDLLCKLIRNMSDDDICRALKFLGAEKILDNLNGGRKQIEINDTNNKILDALYNTQRIFAYEVAKDGRHYKKVKRYQKSKKSSIADRLL